MYKKYILSRVFILFFFVHGIIFAQTTNVAPILNATGNQVYCPEVPMKIVTDMSIIDPDDLGIDAIYIQISSGYVNGQDVLSLSGTHPTISSSWDALTGKLTLSGVTSIQPTYIALIAAIEDVEFYNNSTNPSGTRTFSITVGQANYLPSNQHYYQYIPNIGVTWTTAKSLAESSFYYGLQGYLATITAADEAQLSGEQAAGAGWIGGSDVETEGIWKWMTGPEAGSNFTFTFWNSGEPNNNLGDEDYAHVTAPGVGILGSWNDLSNTGNTSGSYQPKGYIVEYGGTPGDPVLQISTSTTITMPSITATTPSSICGNGSVTLQATSSTGTVNWFSDAVGGILISTGTSFTTPTLSTTTTYYVNASPSGCSTGNRTPIVATINEIPVVSVTTPLPICSENTATLSASTTIGTISWYASMTSSSVLATGTSFTTPTLNNTTTFYAEANNNGCISNRISITVIVNPLPNVIDESFEICENDSLILNAGITGMSYLWSTGATTQSILHTGLNNYSVIITNSNNCSKTKNFTINQFLAPEILEIQTNNLTATIITTQPGDFEYSIDGINYQDSNVFTLEEGGLYKAYVREVHDCGLDSENFIIISIPQFFSPNGDGINDTWYVKGLIHFPKSELKIFDRFGKLITILNRNNTSWDGFYNGKQLISDDYWFVFKTDENSIETKGHFSMVR